MLSSSRRKVKIVCTLGPSSRTEEAISALIHEGMDIARLNFSHGDHEFHKGTIAAIRAASKRLGKPIAIMQDVQGPKIRVGKLPKGELQLKAGDVLLLYPEGSQPRTSTDGKILVPISAEIAQSVSSDTRG